MNSSILLCCVLALLCSSYLCSGGVVKSGKDKQQGGTKPKEKPDGVGPGAVKAGKVDLSEKESNDKIKEDDKSGNVKSNIEKPEEEKQGGGKPDGKEHKVIVEPDGVIIEVLREPPTDCGRKVQENDVARVHFKTLHIDGTEHYDTRKTRAEEHTVSIKVGHGHRRRHIRGFDEGFLGMCKGEVRKLTVPSRLAYGTTGRGKIKPNETVVYEVDLVDIIPRRDEL